MKIKHYTAVDEQITNIELEKNESLLVEHSAKDITHTFKIGNSKLPIDRQWQSVSIDVEDNLFVITAIRDKKTDKFVFSDIWGFCIKPIK